MFWLQKHFNGAHATSTDQCEDGFVVPPIEVAGGVFQVAVEIRQNVKLQFVAGHVVAAPIDFTFRTSNYILFT